MFRDRPKHVIFAIAIVLAVVFWLSDFDHPNQVDTGPSFSPNIDQSLLLIAGDQETDPTPSPEVIDSALRALSAGPKQDADLSAEDGDSTDEWIGYALSQGENDKRLEAISRLGRSPNSRAALTLVSLLDDDSPLIREEAVEALGVLGSGTAILGLGYALSDANASIRRSAIEMLAAIGSDEALYELTMTLSDWDPALREAAVYEVTDINSPAALGLLEQFLADDDPKVRQLAADHLIATIERYNKEVSSRTLAW